MDGFLEMKKLLGAKIISSDYVKRFTGDRITFFKYLEQDLGLIILTDDEKAKIERAMDVVEKSGDQSLIYVAIQNVLFNRAGIAWTTLGHTGACVPVSASI